MNQLLAQGPASLKSDLEALLRGDSITRAIPEGLVFPTLEQNADAIWALLLYAGYLTPVVMPTAPNVPCELRIPNEEVRQIYTAIIQEWFNAVPDLYRETLRALVAGEVKAFAEAFQDLLRDAVSVFDAPSEQMYHFFVLGMLVALRNTHLVQSNRESGYGRYDVMVIPKDPAALGIVLEFKLSRTKSALAANATAALKQIVECKYAADLHARGIKRVLAIGLAFNGKRMAIKYRSCTCSGGASVE